MAMRKIARTPESEFWIIYSDVGTPIITNGKQGKQRIFLECENILEAEEQLKALQNESLPDEQPETPIAARHPRLMYIERKAGSLIGTARIGFVTYSNTHRTLYYRGKSFRSLNGAGYKSNYYEVETGEEYWISGCKRNGSDRLYGERIPVEIDEDARETYWTAVRGQPENRHRKYSNM